VLHTERTRPVFSPSTTRAYARIDEMLERWVFRALSCADVPCCTSCMLIAHKVQEGLGPPPPSHGQLEGVGWGEAIRCQGQAVR
jgi:hypothetical protein